MYNLATDYEVENFAKLETRLIRISDFYEYYRTFNESSHSIKTYFDLGNVEKRRPLPEVFAEFKATLKDKTIDLYGIFDNRRLLGVGAFSYCCFSPNGCQITIWIRANEKGKGLGTYFLKRLSNHGLHDKKFRFTELLIDEENLPSRRMAEKAGYELLETMEAITQGTKGSGTYCRYICFDGTIDAIAENYHKQPIDLIDHPAYDIELRDLIHDDYINEYLKWPFPIQNERKYEGEPFGLELDKLRKEAYLEDLEWNREQLKSISNFILINIKYRNRMTFQFKGWSRPSAN